MSIAMILRYELRRRRRRRRMRMRMDKEKGMRRWRKWRRRNGNERRENELN